MALSNFVDTQGQQWVVLMGPSYLDGTHGQKLLDAVDKLLEARFVHIVLDFSETKVINSIGVSRLIQMIETLEKQNGRVAFCTVSGIIARTFKMMGLLNKASIFESVETASKSLP